MSRRTRRAGTNGWAETPTGRSRFFGAVVKLCAAVVVLALAAIGGILLWPLMQHQEHLDGEVAVLEAERDGVRAVRDRKRAELDWLNSDAGYIEAVARDELDRYRPGEVIYQIERPVDR